MKKTFKLSITVIKTSWVPIAFISVKTLIQKAKDSIFLPNHTPRASLLTSLLSQTSIQMVLLMTLKFSLTLSHPNN